MDIQEQLSGTEDKELDWKSQLWQTVEPKLRNRNFWQAAGLLLLANFIVAILGLIRTPLLTWVFPKNEVGMLAVVATWMPFLQLASLTGLDGASYHYVSKGQIWAYIVNLRYRLRWSLISSAGFLLGAVYWYYQNETITAILFGLAGITLPFTTGLTASAGTLGALEEFKKLFWFRIFEGLTRFAGFLPVFISTIIAGKVVLYYGINQLALSLMLIIVAIFLSQRLIKSIEQPVSMEEKNEMVHYGKHLTIINGISVLQNRTDALLVGLLLPLGTMADYSIGLLAYGQIKRLWGIFSMIRYPPLVRMPLRKRQKRFLIEGTLIFLVFFIFGILASAAAHLLVPILLPASYLSSLIYIDLLIASFVVAVPGFIIELYYRSRQDEKRLYILRITGAITGIILPTIFIIVWGGIGGAIGRILSSSIFSITGFLILIL
jgi:O-antigen/teichoic acid export membrane protein